MISELCEQEEHGACFDHEIDGCHCACHPADCLAGIGRTTTEQPSTGGARQANDPAVDRQPYAGQCTRVYTRTGMRAHLMSPVQSIRNGSALCRVLPEWFTEWRGTGSQAEIDRAASLPVCKHCEDQAQREDAYYAEGSQWSNPEARAL